MDHGKRRLLAKVQRAVTDVRVAGMIRFRSGRLRQEEEQYENRDEPLAFRNDQTRNGSREISKATQGMAMAHRSSSAGWSSPIRPRRV